jgi:hypothetical protein
LRPLGLFLCLLPEDPLLDASCGEVCLGVVVGAETTGAGGTSVIVPLGGWPYALTGPPIPMPELLGEAIIGGGNPDKSTDCFASDCLSLRSSTSFLEGLPRFRRCSGC